MTTEITDIKELRTSMCLSVTDLAAWLRVPRSVLSMAESNRRLLPIAAEQKLVEIQQAMNNGTAALPEEAAAYTQNTSARELQKYLVTCYRQLIQLQCQQMPLQLQAEKAENKLKVMRVLLAALPEGEDDIISGRRWLLAQQADAIEKLKAYGAAQAPLLVKMEVLNHAIALVKEKQEVA